MIRRLIFVIAFVPVLLFLGLKWVITGDDPNHFMDAFIEWGTQ